MTTTMKTTMKTTLRRRLGGPVLLGALLAACGGESPTAPQGALDAGRAGRWATASPADQGLDPAVLAEFERSIDAGSAGSVSSLLVLRRGTLIYERYWDGWTADDLHPVYSVTKSVTSLLVGMARADGALGDLDLPVLEALPAYDVEPWPFGRPGGVSLRHVLQMRTGFEWDELSTDYRQEANPTTDLVESPDWVRHVLELPHAAPPGERFTYNSGVSMLMAAVIRSRVGERTEAYAARRLFAPLGIESWSWGGGPGGLTNSGWGLQLRPRDMAAIGQLVLQNGSWDGTRIVPADWVAESAEAATRFTDGTGYGYQWWLLAADGGARPRTAWGYGGQYVIVIPSLEIVMVTTAENFGSDGIEPGEVAAWAYRAAGALIPG